jgi:flagellar biosynthetic protein FliR
MNIEMLNLLDRFYALIWPMLRISAFLAFSSIFSIRAVNLRIRIAIGLVLTIFLSMQLEVPKIDPATAEGLKEIFNQLFIGFAMALLMQLATAGIVLAGQAVSGSMGLSMANMIDPTLGNVPVVSQFFTIIGTLVFLSIGGHLIVFAVLLESFTLFPIGKSLMTQDVLGKMTAWGAMMFVSALLISLPVPPPVCSCSRWVCQLFCCRALSFCGWPCPASSTASVGCGCKPSAKCVAC